MKPRGYVLGLFLVFLPCVSLAAERIESAFGFRLGEKFDESLSLWPTPQKLENGNLQYDVTPKVTNGLFKSCEVIVTPKTKLITKIIGTARPDTLGECNNEHDRVANLLRNKYGNATSENTNYYKYKEYDTGRFVELGGCSHFIRSDNPTPYSITIKITYEDEVLTRKGADEGYGISGHKDSSGL